MNLFNIHGKIRALAICWVLLTIAMPGLAVLSDRCATENKQQWTRLSELASNSAQSSALQETNQAPEQNEKSTAEYKAGQSDADLFVITLEKQVFGCICPDFLVCSISENHGTHDYQDLVVQLPAKPTLRRLEILLQV